MARWLHAASIAVASSVQWQGPFAVIYSDGDCPNLGCHDGLDVSQCESLCEQTNSCNAFNFAQATGTGCCLRGCSPDHVTKPSMTMQGEASYYFVDDVHRWRIMAMGDSITLGVGSDGGYRCVLSSMLDDSGIAHAMVGPLGDKCGGHAGYNGNTIKQIAEHLTPEVLAAADADVVALQAGTNDFYFYDGNPDDEDQLGANATCGLRRLEALLDELYASKDSLIVALSTTTVINVSLCEHYHEAPWHPGDCPADMPANIAAFNEMLPDLVQRQRVMSRSIFLHDINAEAQWVFEDWYNWGIHFSPIGYQKMAMSCFNALKPLAPSVTIV